MLFFVKKIKKLLKNKQNTDFFPHFPTIRISFFINFSSQFKIHFSAMNNSPLLPTMRHKIPLFPTKGIDNLTNLAFKHLKIAFYNLLILNYLQKTDFFSFYKLLVISGLKLRIFSHNSLTIIN